MRSPTPEQRGRRLAVSGGKNDLLLATAVSIVSVLAVVGSHLNRCPMITNPASVRLSGDSLLLHDTMNASPRGSHSYVVYLR